MKVFLICLIGGLFALAPLPATASAATAVTVTGAHGEILSISQTRILDRKSITVTRKNFDETVGIYLGLCVVPKKGQLPTPCGGGINKQGISKASQWISSNPPPYGSGLAKPYLPGGRFTYSMTLSKMIGKANCAKLRCAITVRADHLRSEDRTYDLFIPVTFK